MKVKELIEMLKQFDPDMPVFLSEEGGLSEPTGANMKEEQWWLKEDFVKGNAVVIY